MSNYKTTKHKLREVFLFLFNSKKRSAECHRVLLEMHGEYALSIKTYEYWEYLRSSYFDTVDKECPGLPKKFDSDELEALLDQGSCPTQDELSESLNVNPIAVSKC
ncbi:transposase [Caerostris darwini]|uniref:Transposase n=1 Tax=Caerostris darwini TaxID=1538125 RepID=A0AAV4X258_9ARAC|nr:transposase [Caerostris darwini]